MLHESGSFGIERRADVGLVGILDFGAVDGSVPSVGRILASSRCCVLKLVESRANVSWHGDFNSALDVVPVERESKVQSAGPIDRNLVELLEGIDEVVSMFLADIFDSEIVNNEGESYRSGFVFPERWSARHWSVAESCEMLLEAVVGNASSLFEAGHALANFDVHVSVRDKVEKVILGDDFVGDQLDWQLHVLVPFHGGAIVKVFDIEDHELGVGSGDSAVEETFSCGQASALGGGDTGKIESVAAHSDTDTMCLGFVGSDGRNEAPIGDLAADRDSTAFDESDGVGAGGHAGTNALGEASEVVGEGLDPNVFIRTGAEGRVLERLAGDVIDDGVGLWMSDVIHARA